MSASSELSHLSEISRFRHEWPVLLECASPHVNVSKLRELVRSADCGRLLLLAEVHGVIGHLAAALEKLDDSPASPEFQNMLSERRRAWGLQSLRITAELFRVLERVAAGGIAAIVLKGPVLSVQAYGDPAMRSYGDVDLLVRERDIGRATELIVGAGYEAKIPVAAIEAERIPGQYLFQSHESKLAVELHNERTLRYFPRRLPIEEFFARQTAVPLDGHRIPALCVEDELVLICIHGAKHFWERLVWIADVAALVTRQTHLDWQRVRASANEVGGERMLHVGLRLASEVLNWHLPERMFPAVEEDAEALRLARRIFTWLPAAGYASPCLMERALFRVRTRGGLTSGLTYLLRLTFSPTEEDWDSRAAKSRPTLLEVIGRPFRLAKKYRRVAKS